MKPTLTMAVLTAVFLAGSGRAQESERPNIVFVLVDDLRWDGTGATGHPFVDTQNLNELASEGIVFRNAFVTTPLCSPSRASFLTGRYARSHGVIDNGLRESLYDVTTFPELLEDAGYRTAFIGKWHMGSADDPWPGFTRWISFSGQGRYRREELNIDGRRVPTRGHLTDVLNEHALAFVRDAVAEPEPFLLYLSHKAVHEPFSPPTRHADIYHDEPVPCPPGCDDSLAGKRALTRFVPNAQTPAPVPGRTGPSEAQIREQMSLVPSIDDGLGHVVRALRTAGVLDRTVIVFTSDNGFFHREHGLGDKRWPYEEAIRIPLIVRYPPLTGRGGVNDELVLNIDLAPTLLELTGVSPPPGIDGRSLVPLLAGESTRWRASFLAEYFEESPFPRIPTWEAIRTERFKLIRYPALGREFDELYDLALDPHELRNEVTNGDYSDTVGRLEALLDSLIESTPHNVR